MATRDRPDFLPVALACWQHQTYSPLELIVVDDGSAFPANAEIIARSGGRLLRVDAGTPLGTKLNLALARARGAFCIKADDDDWYGPTFLEVMVARCMDYQSHVCRPTVAALAPFLVFDVGRWQLSEHVGTISGATLFFARDDWAHCQFRDISLHESAWFCWDQTEAGASFLPVRALETYLAIRHGGDRRNRGHAWTLGWTGPGTGEHPRQRRSPLVPEQLLPEWALEVYRNWDQGALVDDHGSWELVLESPPQKH